MTDLNDLPKTYSALKGFCKEEFGVEPKWSTLIKFIEHLREVAGVEIIVTGSDI